MITTKFWLRFWYFSVLLKIQSMPVIDCSSKFALVRNYQEILIIYHSKLDDSYKKPLRAKKAFNILNCEIFLFNHINLLQLWGSFCMYIKWKFLKHFKMTTGNWCTRTVKIYMCEILEITSWKLSRCKKC